MSSVRLTVVYPSDPLGGHVGGTSVFLSDLVRFAPMDFDVHWVGLTTDPGARPVLQRQKLQTGVRGYSFTPLLLETDLNRKKCIPLSLRFTWALRKNQHLLSRDVLLFNRLEPALVCRQWPVPQMVVLHNDIPRQIFSRPSDVFWSKIPWAYKILEKKLMPQMHRVYTVSENTVQYLKQCYPEQKESFQFLPTWVDPEQFGPAEDSRETLRMELQAQFQLPTLEGPWFLFAGRLQTQKDPQLLLQVFREWVTHEKSGCLLLAGEGNLRPDLEEWVQTHHLQGKIIFLGGIARETLKKCYQASDVLLLTSHYEGMPICVLEALQCGLPVVAPDVGEVRRVVKPDQSGELSQDRSVSAIFAMLQKVVQNRERYSVSNCHEAVAPFNPQAVLEPVFSQMRECVS